MVYHWWLKFGNDVLCNFSLCQYYLSPEIPKKLSFYGFPTDGVAQINKRIKPGIGREDGAKDGFSRRFPCFSAIVLVPLSLLDHEGHVNDVAVLVAVDGDGAEVCQGGEERKRELLLVGVRKFESAFSMSENPFGSPSFGRRT